MHTHNWEPVYESMIPYSIYMPNFENPEDAQRFIEQQISKGMICEQRFGLEGIEVQLLFPARHGMVPWVLVHLQSFPPCFYGLPQYSLGYLGLHYGWYSGY